MYRLVYVYLDVVCLLILSFIYYRMGRSNYLSDTSRSFSRVVVNAGLVLVLDVVDALASGHSYVICEISNATFLVWTGVVGLQWLVYTMAAIGLPEASKAVRLFLAIPVIVLAVLCYASIWTGWIFWIDPATMLYHRGPFHFAQVTLAALYLVAAAGLTVRELASCQSPQRRRELLTLLTFFVLPAIGAALDVAIYGIPFTWTLCTVAVVMVFVNFQEYSISIDALTGLNNRRQFESGAEKLVEGNEDDGRPAFLLLMDIDRFKLINDAFGHRTGDAALVETADLLKQAVGDRHLLLARYGGDEFAVMGRLDNMREALEVKREIAEAFERRNMRDDTPYHITLSIGVAQAGAGLAKNVDELVSMADKMLYEEKGAAGSSR